MRRNPAQLAVWGLWLAGALGAAQAQERDPTRPPPEASAPAATGSAHAGVESLPEGIETMSVLVRDGKPFLVSGTRLLAPGQMLGNFKLERITETEIWLRRGKDLRKVSRFGAIQRRVATPVPPAQP